MYNYNYKLKYGSEVYKCTNNVTGFEDEGVKFGKASENKGVIKSYASEIQLIGRDCEWLKNIYLTKGFNEQVKFEVYKSDFLKGDSLEYSAYIDMSTVVVNVNRCTFSLKQGGFITYLDNIIKKEFTLSNNSGFVPVNYYGNKYDFEIDIVSNTQIMTSVNEDKTKYILPTVVKENNDNYEDIRLFTTPNQKEIKAGTTVNNDSCFINIGVQKYIDTIKYNFNILSFKLKNVGATTVQYTRSLVKYKFELYAFNNIKESWELNDSSRIFISEHDVYLQYTTRQVVDPYVSGIETMTVIGECINPNYNYVFEDDIKQYLTYENSDNIKFILTVNVANVYIYDADNNIVIFTPSDIDKFEITTNVDIKCTFKDFQLVPFKLINSWKVVDVYKYIMLTQRSKYQVNYDLRNLEVIPYYLTSASELCGGTTLTTTLENLLQFIYIATGLRQIINENNGVYHVYFEKYENSFKDVEIAKIDNCSEVVINCEPDKIFTDVEVGWHNKETGIFKSSEYNTVNNFRSGYTNIENNTLSLFCNYSASITDLETIAYNSGYNDKSNDAKEVFIIECYNDNGVIYNKQFVGTGTMKLCGNVGLTPRRLIEVHKFELSDFFYHINNLKFNSTNGKADIVIEGIREDSDVILNNQLMQPFILDFEGVINQSVIKVDVNKYGYFTFKYNGEYIRGWIAEGTDSVSVAANGNVSKLRLIVKKSVYL